MSARSVQTNTDSFKRDVLRDFCLAVDDLNAQFNRFEQSGGMSFPILADLVGDVSNKGLLWRVKDGVRLLQQGEESEASNYLDWTIGFLFHECIKILESTYQLQQYAPRLVAISRTSHTLKVEENALDALTQSSLEDLKKEVRRAKSLIRSACRLFCLYFEGKAKNRPLARLLYDRRELVRRVFKNLYEDLLKTIYGDNRAGWLLEAAKSLAKSGRNAKARQALEEALGLSPDNTEALNALAGLDKDEGQPA